MNEECGLWYCRLITLALELQRQENAKFKNNLGYKVRPWLKEEKKLTET